MHITNKKYHNLRAELWKLEAKREDIDWEINKTKKELNEIENEEKAKKEEAEAKLNHQP